MFESYVYKVNLVNIVVCFFLVLFSSLRVGNSRYKVGFRKKMKN